MSKQDDEILKKLVELEASITEEKQQEVSVVPPTTTLTTVDESDNTMSDVHLTIGGGLLLVALFLFFHHVRIGTGFMTWLGLGPHGFGLMLIPLLVGIGILFYDYKNRIGWIVTAASCALVFFAVLSQLVMTFPSISMLGLFIMLLPLAAGGAFIAKGLLARKKKK